MSLNTTQKHFLLLILGIAALVAVIYWLAFVVPGIGEYVYMAVLGIVGLFVLYISILPLSNYLSEHADNILGVYADESGRGVHIFSSFSVSRYKIMQPSIRHIQYFFIDPATGKKYYSVLFNHEQRPLAGQAGYTGYSSFESSVLNSEELKHALENFSLKTKSELRPGKQIGSSGKDYYKFSMGDHTIEIKKTSGIFDDIFKVSGYAGNPERLIWKKRL